MTKQSEALLALADRIEEAQGKPIAIDPQAAAELRRLHALNQELLDALKAIKDGTQFWESYPSEHCYGKARLAIAKATGEQQ